MNQEIIDNLYSVFNKYTTSDMHHCPCGCIDLDDVKKLASKRLKELEEDDFSSYHGSALYTWGDISHYKHFLPRILEVHHILGGKGMIGIDEIKTKLEYANWTTWDKDERQAIKEFILADWTTYVNEKESNIWTSDFEGYSFFIDISTLFRLWEISKSNYGLKNFVQFFYYYGIELLYEKVKDKDQLFLTEFKSYINQKNLLNVLEEEFFKADLENKEYAEKISFVLQMIEQESKNNK